MVPFQYNHNHMADPTHLEILLKGPECWNKWREENPATHPDLSNIDFNATPDFQHALRRVNLSFTNFSNSQCTGLILHKSKLENAIFRESILHGCCFYESELINIDFYGASLNKCLINNSSISKSNFEMSDMRNSKLYKSSFVGNKNTDIRVFDDFWNNHFWLTYEIFTGSSFIRCKLDDAHISDCIFFLCDFMDSSFKRSTICDSSIQHCNLTRANMIRSNFRNTDLSYSYLYRSNARHSHFDDINLTGTLLSKSDLSHAEFTDVTFDRSTSLLTSMRNILSEVFCPNKPWYLKKHELNKIFTNMFLDTEMRTIGIYTKELRCDPIF